MSTVKADISMSLDGYIDAGGITPAEVMGPGGEALHQWLEDMDELSAAALERTGEGVGALICGRRTYDLSLQFWGPHGPSGPERRVPMFVLTHSAPEQVPDNSVYHFVHGEPKEVLGQVRDATGDQGVAIMGGADVIQQFLSAGLVDEIHVHLAPVLLGAGTRLFDLDLPSQIRLEQERVDSSPSALHLLYRVR